MKVSRQFRQALHLVSTHEFIMSLHGIKKKNRFALSVFASLCLLSAGNALSQEFLLRNPFYPDAPEEQGRAVVSEQQLVLFVGDQPPEHFVRHPVADNQFSLAYLQPETGATLLWPIQLPGRIVVDIPNVGRVMEPWDLIPSQAPNPSPRRQIRFLQNPPLPPVTVEFTNRHSEEVICQLIDRRNPNAPVKFVIQPGESVKKRIQRDAGQTRQVVAIDPGGSLLGIVSEAPVPPQGLYDLTVYENRVQSTYIDRTGKDSLVPQAFLPPQQSRSPRSIGVFALPPGEALKQGSRVDVFASAKRAGNPGGLSRWPVPFPTN